MNSHLKALFEKDTPLKTWVIFYLSQSKGEMRERSLTPFGSLYLPPPISSASPRPSGTQKYERAATIDV